MNTENANFKTHAEHVAEVLSRWSVSDLIEQTNEDLERADALFYKAKAEIEILDEGQTHYINWWRLKSGEKTYEVRRFRSFVFCSCAGFFFSRKCCKHIARTAGVMCANCHDFRAKIGKLCRSCDSLAAPFRAQASPVVIAAGGRP